MKENNSRVNILFATLLTLTLSQGIFFSQEKRNLEEAISLSEIDNRTKSAEIARLGSQIENYEVALNLSEGLNNQKSKKILSQEKEIEELKKAMEAKNKRINELSKKVLEEKRVKPEEKVLSNTTIDSVNGEQMTMSMTGYVATCKGCSGITASGYDVRNTIYYNGMRVVASDNNVLPLNSIIKIEGFNEKFIVLDRGGGIKGNELDIMFNSVGEANKFGVQKRKVTVIRKGA